MTALPDGPVVVATALPAARKLLERDLPTPATSGSTVLLDTVVRRCRGDAFVVSDLDGPGWVEAFFRTDRSLSPPGIEYVQTHRPVRSGETRAASLAALEDLVDVGAPDWRDRAVWRRHGAAHHRTGALDLPGHTGHDRPAIDQGDGVFLAGDEVAAPGLLAKVSFASAVDAAGRAAREQQRLTARTAGLRARG